VRFPCEHVDTYLHFADATSARVFRETVVERGPTLDPCVLVVEFRLRLVRGWGHALFRRECLLNTPLFVGFPGFVSKLWLADDQHGVYRGVYEWDGAARAEYYARSLWRILELGCVPGSIHYIVLPGLRRDQVLQDPDVLVDRTPDRAAAWWRPVGGSPLRAARVRVPLRSPESVRSGTNEHMNGCFSKSTLRRYMAGRAQPDC
jgi:hypothetical protein